MTVRKTSPLHSARKAVSAELGLPADDWRVVRLSVLVASYNGLQASLAAGHEINIGDLLALDAKIAEVRKELKPAAPTTLKVSFVDSARGRFKCSKCGEENEIKNDTPASVSKPVQHTSPVAPAASITSRVGGAGSIAEGRVAPPKNVVPIQTADQRAAELRKAARISNNTDPGGPQAPRHNYNFPDNESPAALSRRIEQSYR